MEKAFFCWRTRLEIVGFFFVAAKTNLSLWGGDNMKIKESVTVPSADASLEIQYWIWDCFGFGNNKNLQELALCICLLACAQDQVCAHWIHSPPELQDGRAFPVLCGSPICVTWSREGLSRLPHHDSACWESWTLAAVGKRRILAAAGFILTSVPRARHTSWNSLNYTPSEGAKVKMALQQVLCDRLWSFEELFFFFSQCYKKKVSPWGEVSALHFFVFAA